MKKALLLALIILIAIGLSGCIRWNNDNGDNNNNGNDGNNGDNDMPVFTQIGSDDACFWSSLAFGGKIYFGGYGYPKGYNYPPWTLIKSFAAGESITRFGIFNSKLYCITENKGYIYRMNTANPTDWVVVHDDGYKYGLGMAVLGSYIYGSFGTSGILNTKIVYSSNGTSWPQANNWAGGEIVVLVPYTGKVYALGRKGAFGGKIWARRGTTTSWADVGALCSNTTVGTWRAGVVFNGNLFLGMGDRSDGKTKVYRFDGTNLSGELFSISAFKSHYACVCNGYMYWLFGPHMNQGSSSAVNYYLYRTPTGEPGSWEHLHTFSVNPVSSHGKYRTKGCVGSLGNDLYVAVQNKVYKMGVVAPPPPPPPLEEDHRGADWIISADTKVAGKHTNVGTFKVNPGVTAIVEAYNGSLYGTLEVHAADIDIGGNIIASGKGYGGGGGGAGSGSNYKDCPSAPNGAPGSGVARGSNGGNAEGCPGYQCTGGGGKGGKGGGPYGGGGGAGGDNNICNYHTGAHGLSGRKGGYAKAEGQGDATKDESLRLGSGGGAGGGGQAAGGRSGIDMYGGGGGGGAGNRGGGWIKLYATASIAISGNIHAKGLDNSAGNGAGGGCGAKENRGGNGGNAAVAGGSNEGAGGRCKGGQTWVYPGGNGGEGSWGAGGGILLKCPADSAISIKGTIDDRGGGDSPDNGGTVKIFYAGTIPSIARVYTGRLYTQSLETFTETTITCPNCGSTLKLTVSSVESKNLPMICPVCGEMIGTGYTVAIITELPWPIYTKKSIICPQCSSELELTISSKPEENIDQSCPVCGAPAD